LLHCFESYTSSGVCQEKPVVLACYDGKMRQRVPGGQSDEMLNWMLRSFGCADS
jgi:hypothetical protein